MHPGSPVAPLLLVLPIWPGKLEFCQQHYEDVIRNDHASGSFIRELWIEREAKLGKKLDRLVEIFDWQIHKNLGAHGGRSVVR